MSPRLIALEFRRVLALLAAAFSLPVAARATAGIDLAITSLQTPPMGVIGAHITGMVARLQNTGSSDAPTFKVRFYLGRSSGVSASDIDVYWSCTFSDGLRAGASTSCAGEIGIPDGLTSGMYYVAAVADPTGALGDVNPANNTRVSDSGPIALLARVAGAFDPSDGSGPLATNLQNPYAARADSAGNLYIADRDNSRIRKVTAGGVVTTVLGNGNPASAGELGWLNFPEALTVDTLGNVYVADTGNHRVLKLSSSGSVSVFAGLGVSGYNGDNISAATAALSYPSGICFDASGNAYIADWGNGRVRKVNPSGVISTLASVQYPFGMAADGQGYLYVSDYWNRVIRRISPAGGVSIYAGNGARDASAGSGAAASMPVGLPSGLAIDSGGSLYIADWWNNLIWRVDPSGSMTIFAGKINAQDYSGDGGAARSAALDSPRDIGFDQAGNAYIADAFNDCVRKVSAQGVISTFAGARKYDFNGDGTDATQATLYYPSELAADASGNLYIADSGNGRVRKVTPAKSIATVAGSDSYGDAGDGGAATAASFRSIDGIAVDTKGNLHISDGLSHRVRKVSTGGTISGMVGSGSAGKNGDSGNGASFQLNSPGALATDSNDNLYIADTGNFRVLRVTPQGSVSTFAGNGTDGDAGDNGPAASASIGYIYALAADRAGNVYLAQHDRIRKVTPQGVIVAFAGTSGSSGFAGDNGPATSAKLSLPTGITIDASGKLYFVDQGTERVRMVTAAGSISTLLGNGHIGFAAFNDPWGIALDPAGNIWVSDYYNHRVLRLGSADAGCGYSLSVASASYGAGGGSGSFDVSTSAGCSWTASTSAAWIHIPSGASGSGAGTVRYSVDANTVSTSRSGTIVAGGQTFTITQTEVSGPTIAPGGVVNAADLAVGPLAPGSIVSISGSNLAPASAEAAGAPLPTVLSGVQVRINSLPAPLLSVSAGRIQAQVPWEVAGSASLSIQVVVNGAGSNIVTAPSAAAAPALFARLQAGEVSIATHALDGTPVTSTNPGHPGEKLSLSGNGFGPVTNQPATGAAAGSAPASLLLTAPAITVGGVPAVAPFAGLAPGTVGKYEIDFELPSNSPLGAAVPLAITTAASRISATLPVAPPAFRIDSLGNTAAAPFSMLTITGQGFDSKSRPQVRFYNGNGYSVTVPAVMVAPTALAAAVPVLFDPSGNFLSDSVTVEVSQSFSSGVVTSNAISGLQISAPPAAGQLPPGAVTLAFLNAGLGAVTDLQGRIGGTALDTPDMRDQLAGQVARFQNLVSQVESVMNGGSAGFSIGQINGADLTVGPADLARSDQLVAGLVNVFAGAMPDLTAFGPSFNSAGQSIGSRFLPRDSLANAAQVAAQAALAAISNSGTTLAQLNQAFTNFIVTITREHRQAATYTAMVLGAAVTGIAVAALLEPLGAVAASYVTFSLLAELSTEGIAAFAVLEALDNIADVLIEFCREGMNIAALARAFVESVGKKALTVVTGVVGMEISATITFYKLLELVDKGCSGDANRIEELTLSDTTVVGGATTTGIVILAHPAEGDGVVVGLSCIGRHARVSDNSVTVAPLQTQATFKVTTDAVSASETATIIAGVGDTPAKSVALLLQPPEPKLIGLKLSPNPVVGGNPVTGTVTLSAAALIPTDVLLFTDGPVHAPSSVSVPAGRATADFTITTSAVTAQTVANITASLDRVTQTAALTITAVPLALTGLTIAPNSVTGGASATGTVTLSAKAPQGGVDISLQSSDSAAQAPVKVTVAAGDTQTTFVVTTSAVTAQKTVTISASLGGVTKNATLTVNPPAAPLAFHPPANLPQGTAGAAYAYSFCQPAPTSTTALCGTFPPTTDPTGGVPPYHFQLDTGGGFPPFGMTLNLNGLLTGAPNAAGTTDFRVCAVDAAANSICQPVRIIVVAATAATLSGNFSGSTTGTSGCIWNVTITGTVTATIAGAGTPASPYTGNATATLKGTQQLIAGTCNPNSVLSPLGSSGQMTVSISAPVSGATLVEWHSTNRNDWVIMDFIGGRLTATTLTGTLSIDATPTLDTVITRDVTLTRQ